MLRDGAPVGERVAVIGAGGIGFDVAEYLTDGGEGASLDAPTYFRQWGVDMAYTGPGGLTAPERPAPPRTVHLLQRKASKVGAGLGKTTGWIHRTELKHRGVTMTAGVTYERIDDRGLHITVDGTLRAGGRHGGAVHRPGAAALPVRGAERGRPRGAPHRRRGRRRRAGRQARHRPGHPARGRPVTGRL
ncbi:hypothetical protein ACFQ60_26330 [Streptomyces zhihengii]